MNSESRDTGRSPLQRIETRADRKAWLVVVGLVLVSLVVESLSALKDIRRFAPETRALQTWLEQGSSHVVILLVIAIVPFMLSRAPIRTGLLARSLALHALATLVFSSVHIVLMVWLRKLTYPVLLGEGYTFGFSDPSNWIYEYRKDVQTYVYALIIFASMRAIEEGRLERETALSDARSRHRITLKSGGRTIYVDAGDFIRAQAQANYAEVVTRSARHLVRMTLNELAGLLESAGVETVRAHRSHLVSREMVSEVRPTGDGGAIAHLNNGDEVPVSRQRRAAFEAEA